MRIKQTVLLMAALIMGVLSYAQDAIQWEFTAKKIGGKAYEVHLTAKMGEGWHIYSQSTPSGGPNATKIIFTNNPLIMLTGKPKEMGYLETKHEEVWGIDVKYYTDGVDFVQTVQVKSAVKTNLTGSISFQTCTDQMCLPPTTEKFSIPLN